MATKSYSKHKEYKEYSTSGNIPYTDEQFDMIKSDLLPKGSKLDSLGRGGGAREYHYEYKEEKLPSGQYDRKDLRTVEEYTIPPKSIPKNCETSSYYYERDERELPALSSSGMRTYNYETTSSTPGYSKVKSSKVTKELSQNVEELDSLLDDLQKDQERQLYKNGYTSDTAETSSFDYKRSKSPVYSSTPMKAPSSGYSTLKREERLEASSWGSSPPPPATLTRAAEVRQELYREEKTESRVVPPALLLGAPPAACAHCRQPPNTATLSRGGTPMNKVTTTVKTYTYEVPADQDPATAPLPVLADHQHTYVSSTAAENLRTTRNSSPAPAPAQPGGCQHCSHCNSHTREYRSVATTDDHSTERMVYPSPANETKLLPSDPHNGHSPYGPTSYKYSETSYSSSNTSQRYPGAPHPPHSPAPHSLRHAPSPSPSPGPFPRPTTPLPGTQQPPKKLDDLLADFPEARFPTQPDGVMRRRVEVTHENSTQSGHRAAPPSSPPTSLPAKPTPVGGSRNVAGPAVYYPPGHTPFAKKDAPIVAGGGSGYQASAMRGGGAYASGRGMYEYESGSRSKEKHSETKTAVPICLPLCCAMPCVIM